MCGCVCVCVCVCVCAHVRACVHQTLSKYMSQSNHCSPTEVVSTSLERNPWLKERERLRSTEREEGMQLLMPKTGYNIGRGLM